MTELAVIDTKPKQDLKGRIREVLRGAHFDAPDDVVDVSDGDDIDDIHVVVISPRFEGRSLGDRSDLIWSALFSGLTPEEWGAVSLAIDVSPSEVNGATIDELKAI